MKIVLEYPENHINLGHIIRTSYCFGIEQIVIPKVCVDHNKKIRNTLKGKGIDCGTINNVNILVVPNILDFLKSQKERKIGLVVQDHHEHRETIQITKFKFEKDDILVFGSEGPGLSNKGMDSCNYLVSIPMKGKMACLNVSMSTAIGLYEATKIEDMV